RRVLSRSLLGSGRSRPRLGRGEADAPARTVKSDPIVARAMPCAWGNPKRVRRLAHCSRLSRSQGLGLAAYRHQRFKLIEALSTDPLRREPLEVGPNGHAPEGGALHGKVPGPTLCERSVGAGGFVRRGTGENERAEQLASPARGLLGSQPSTGQ